MKRKVVSMGLTGLDSENRNEVGGFDMMAASNSQKEIIFPSLSKLGRCRVALFLELPGKVLSAVDNGHPYYYAYVILSTGVDWD